MKSPESDEDLRQELSAWRLNPPRDAAFRSEVWSRIAEADHGRSVRDFSRAHAAPLMASLVLALLLGGWIGREQARSRLASDRAEMARDYVQALDARFMRMP